VPVTPQSGLADLYRLLCVMEKRLALMHDVARWKWKAGQPIDDPEREGELLLSTDLVTGDQPIAIQDAAVQIVESRERIRIGNLTRFLLCRQRRE
jgi:chorismate mutase